MIENLEQLKKELESRIKVIDKRIENISGSNCFDENQKIQNLHREALSYEKILSLLKISGDK